MFIAYSRFSCSTFDTIIHRFRNLVGNRINLFIIRLPKLKKMNNDELSRLILNHSEDEVLEMVHEPGQSNSTNK